MDKISKIYKYLIEYVKEIKVQEIIEFPEDEEGPYMAYDILFNGKNTSGFLEDIDRITFNIKKDLNDSIELENPSKEQIDEIEQIINNLCLDLIAKKSFIEYKCIKEGSQPNVDTFVSEVVEKLHKHKNTWNLKYETIRNQPSNFSLQWNENINKLADIFYQLSQELKNGRKDPLIKTSPVNLAKFIVNNFVDDEGLNLSFDTIYTYLKKNKSDKRPISEKRVEIRYLPM